MEKKNKLKGTRVYVDDDLTKSERERQSEVRIWVRRERERERGECESRIW